MVRVYQWLHCFVISIFGIRSNRRETANGVHYRSVLTPRCVCTAFSLVAVFSKKRFVLFLEGRYVVWPRALRKLTARSLPVDALFHRNGVFRDTQAKCGVRRVPSSQLSYGGHVDAGCACAVLELHSNPAFHRMGSKQLRCLHASKPHAPLVVNMRLPRERPLTRVGIARRSRTSSPSSFSLFFFHFFFIIKAIFVAFTLLSHSKKRKPICPHTFL